LLEKVAHFDTLLEAARLASRGKKNTLTVAEFMFDLEGQLFKLQTELLEGSYRPGEFRYFKICDPKERTIAESPFRDRVVHHAICLVLEPLLERRYIHDSYACRPGKGAHRALARAQQYCRRNTHYLKCDVKKYFDSIDHEVLKSLLRRITKDTRLLRILDLIVDHPGGSKGVPIGNLTSQHFANLYLDRLDHWLKEIGQVQDYLRYMDDFICFGNSKATLHSLRSEVGSFLETHLRLQLKEEVTHVASVHQGLSFLGFRIFPSVIRIKSECVTRCRRKIVLRMNQLEMGKISEAKFLDSVQSLVTHITHGNTLLGRRSWLRTLSLEGENEGMVRNGSNRVIRGGSWNNDANNARCSNRNNNTPTNRNNNIGVRLLSSSESENDAVYGLRRSALLDDQNRTLFR